jgi:hypothetical protein
MAEDGGFHFVGRGNIRKMECPCRGSSLVERGPEKAGVGSSILPLGTLYIFAQQFPLSLVAD